MKKLTILILLLSLLETTYAQEDESFQPVVIGGSLYFNSAQNDFIIPLIGPFGTISPGNSDNPKSTRFSVRPYLGKQISDRFLAGILLDFSLSRYSSTYTQGFPQPETIDFKRNSNQYGFGLFTRHSFVPDSRFDFFLQPFAQYFILHEDEFQNSQQTSEEMVNYFALGTDLGILYNINDKWRATLLVGGLRYVNGSWERVGTNLEEDFSSFGLNLNLSSIQIGMELKL